MVKRMFYLVAALLILSVSAAPSWAAPLDPPSKPLARPGSALQSKPVKMFVGTFVNPAGRVHQIQVRDGGFLNIKNTRENLYYRLWVRTAADGTADVTLEKYLDAEFSVLVTEEQLNVALDGKTTRASLAPFRFSLEGERKARAEFRPDYVPNKDVEGECCIDCGDGWEVCCGVGIYEPGWIACCSIDTECAWCDVCAWWLE